MANYWRQRGLTVPVFVIPRSVEPKVFDRRPGADPFDVRAPRGGRLLCVCRHTREKGIERLIQLFARHVAPHDARATLTLVGDGPDHGAFRKLAGRLGVAARVFFPGEEPLARVPDYHRHADLFVYTSLSETYGQVVSEASWCGLGAVALNDGMGVCSQIIDGQTGILIDTGRPGADVDAHFGAASLALLRDPTARTQMGARAAMYTRARVAPARIVDRYYEAFAEAREHLRTRHRRLERAEKRRRLRGWATLHTALFLLSCIRSAQPNWGELSTGSELRAS
jgi:glycosyltransferase involved in cell wall biosynthesis